MESNILDKPVIARIRIERSDEHPFIPTVNVVFIFLYCTLAVIAVYRYIIQPSLKVIILSASAFLILTIIMELVNEILNTEHVTFKIFENKLSFMRSHERREFDVRNCKITYHEDKTDWLELSCDNQKFTFSLAQRSTNDLFNLINALDNG